MPLSPEAHLFGHGVEDGGDDGRKCGLILGMVDNGDNGGMFGIVDIQIDLIGGQCHKDSPGANLFQGIGQGGEYPCGLPFRFLARNEGIGHGLSGEVPTEPIDQLPGVEVLVNGD